MTDQFSKKSEAWSARFTEPVADLVKRYTASVDFDKRLAMQDIAGSLAHADMLQAVGLLGQADLEAIQRGLSSIRTEIEAGRFVWSLDLEDVHLNIEKRLTELVDEDEATAEYVTQLEEEFDSQQFDDELKLGTGDGLVEEVERYLREQ